MKTERFDKKLFKQEVINNLKTQFRVELDNATQQQIYQAVAYALKEWIIEDWMDTQKTYEEKDPKILYYMSMEFLMGRALGNNLINMSMYGEVKEALEELGVDLNMVEDQEPDPALGNGGLGRLAACFLDSLATLGYAAYGCGIRYQYGMFKQKIKDGYQIEVPDEWLKNGNPFELKRPEYAKEVRFGGNIRTEYDEAAGRINFIQENYQSVMAVPYDYPVVGYGNHIVNTLRIWDAEPITDFQLDSFDKGEYDKAVEQKNLAKNIVEVLYPNDNHYEGKELRLKQQYFFVSASLQAAVAKYKKNHDDITKLYEKMTIQMNDTHPTVSVAELMRILMDEEGLGWDDKNGSLFREMLAFLPQEPVTMFVKESVREDLLQSGDKVTVENVSQRMGIEHLLDRHPWDLSGGEIQKCAFAKILLADPKIIVLDECTKGMDSFAKKALGDILLDLKDEGRTILLVTHDLEFAAQYCDRCGLLFDGKIGRAHV